MKKPDEKIVPLRLTGDLHKAVKRIGALFVIAWLLLCIGMLIYYRFSLGAPLP